MSDAPRRSGSLVVVGTGIRVVGQLSVEAIAWMKTADRLFYLVCDQVAETAVRLLNPKGAESLATHYVPGKPRREAYDAMVARITGSVDSGALTCAAFYGHPGICAFPAHEAVRRVRAAGLDARILPALSTEDCLFAELEYEPAESGCQSYEATYFLRHTLAIDPTAALVLWQAGFLDDPTYQPDGYVLSALPLLAEKLAGIYRPDHDVTIYRASPLPGIDPVQQVVKIQDLSNQTIPPMATVFIRPSEGPRLDGAMSERLNTLPNPAPSKPKPVPKGKGPKKSANPG